MKKLIPITLLLALIVIAGSCTKSKNSSTPSAVDSSFLKATINGNLLSVTGDTVAYAGGSSSGGTTLLYVYGTIIGGKSIKLSLSNVTGTRTIALATGDGSAYYYPFGYLASYSYAMSGSVTLTEMTPYIRGTFNFVTADSTVVTGGSFAVKAL